MEIEFGNCRVAQDKVEVVGKFTARLSDLERMASESGYRNGSIAKDIIDAIASKVASEYLEKNRMEIAKAINLQEIVSAVQLKVVEGFSLQGRG